MDDKGQHINTPYCDQCGNLANGLYQTFTIIKRECMNKIFNKELNDYDKSLIRLLWYAWNSKPSLYTDASGVTMALAINAAFLDILKEDRNMPQLDTPDVSINRVPYFQLQLPDMYGNIHRISLSEVQLEVLKLKLDGHNV